MIFKKNKRELLIFFFSFCFLSFLKYSPLSIQHGKHKHRRWSLGFRGLEGFSAVGTFDRACISARGGGQIFLLLTSDKDFISKIKLVLLEEEKKKKASGRKYQSYSSCLLQKSSPSVTLSERGFRCVILEWKSSRLSLDELYSNRRSTLQCTNSTHSRWGFSFINNANDPSTDWTLNK